MGADDRPAARPDPHQTRVQSLQGDQLTNLQMIYPPCAMHVCALYYPSIYSIISQGLMHSSNDDELKDVKQFLEKRLQ